MRPVRSQNLNRQVKDHIMVTERLIRLAKERNNDVALKMLKHEATNLISLLQNLRGKTHTGGSPAIRSLEAVYYSQSVGS